MQHCVLWLPVYRNTSSDRRSARCCARLPRDLSSRPRVGRQPATNRKMGRVMRQILAIAVCGLSLGACTSGDLFKFESTPVQVRLESQPPGADVRLSTGPATCKTPCTLPVNEAAGEITATYSLEGYQPQQVAIQVVTSPPEPPRINPNPVVVALEAAAAPPARRRGAAKRPAARKPAAKQRASRPTPPPPPPAPPAAQPEPPAPAAPAPAPPPPAAPSVWGPPPNQAPAQQ
jgi:hypothetical protein